MLDFNVLITSFYKARSFDLENKYGVACWKPDWCKYKDIDFLFPLDKDGMRLRLRNFNGSIQGYVDALREGYLTRWNLIEPWLESLDKNQQYLICCWCPHSSTSKEQLRQFGTFFCHTVLIGKMIRMHRPDLIVKLDFDRETKSVPEVVEWYKIFLNRIISGGQTGADRGGLIAGKKLGIETGGWIPKGFKTQEGYEKELGSRYNLKEHDSPYYPPRTFLNVKESDGTIRFATDFQSAGEVCTLKAIKQYDKPYIDINLNGNYMDKVKEFCSWLKCYSIKTLNVAGNSENTSPGITIKVVDFLMTSLKSYNQKA